MRTVLGEFRAGGRHAVVFPLHVVHIEHGGRLALLKHRLLVGLRRWIVVGGELQLGALRLLS